MTDQAISAARRVFRQCRSRDPLRIAKDLDIEVLMRGDFVHQKGAFCVVLDQSFIILNDRLPESELRQVCAHELGHALLFCAAGCGRKSGACQGGRCRARKRSMGQ